MILVTGATGNVGSALVRTLISAGQSPIALSRHAPEPAAGVAHRALDLADRTSYARAFSGATRAFIMAPPGQSLDGAALTAALLSANVEHVVLLSSQGTESRPESPAHAGLRELEHTLRDAFPHATLLRPGGFASNSFAWIPTVKSAGRVAAPFGDVALPVVDPLDIAEVAAAALLEPKHRGMSYTLTGPTAITPRQQAAELSAALDRDLEFQELSRPQAKAFMGQFMPEAIVDGTLDILGDPTPEEVAISPDTQRVLSRPARSYGDWVRRHLHAFRE